MSLGSNPSVGSQYAPHPMDHPSYGMVDKWVSVLFENCGRLTVTLELNQDRRFTPSQAPRVRGRWASLLNATFIYTTSHFTLSVTVWAPPTTHTPTRTLSNTCFCHTMFIMLEEVKISCITVVSIILIIRDVYYLIKIFKWFCMEMWEESIAHLALLLAKQNHYATNLEVQFLFTLFF